MPQPMTWIFRTARVNTKERERANASLIFCSAWFSLPVHLSDTLFVNHQYESVHWNWEVALRLASVVFCVSLATAAASRGLQRVALGLLLSVAMGTAVLSRLGVRTADAQLIGKIVVFSWWIAILLLIFDWVHARVSGTRRSQVQKAEIRPLLPADRARDFFLDRLSRQAMSADFALSDLERQFLDYSRITSDRNASALEEEFFLMHDYGSFKAQVRRLMREAVKSDRVTDPGALKQYYRLLRDLKRGRRDQQLALLVEPGILDGRSGEEVARDFALYIIIGLAVVGALIGVVLITK